MFSLIGKGICSSWTIIGTTKNDDRSLKSQVGNFPERLPQSQLSPNIFPKDPIGINKNVVQRMGYLRDP